MKWEALERRSLGRISVYVPNVPNVLRLSHSWLHGANEINNSRYEDRRDVLLTMSF
jgi:hypothetical protein